MTDTNSNKRLDYLPKRGDGDADKNDRDVERYAVPEHQQELRRRIEAQDLPIREQIEELTDLIEYAIHAGDPMVLLQGETGSGKSVYSPVAVRTALKRSGLMDRVVMIQPRRDAARGIARANAAVTGEQLGKGVGFSTSEGKTVSRNAHLAVVTSGIGVRYAIEGGLRKDNVGAVIVDEIHEGSVEYHLLLGLIKMMRDSGEAPPVLLTSATMHRERVQQFFGIDDDRYMRVEGRTHPVDIEYTAKSEWQDPASRRELSYINVTANKIKEVLQRTDDGDVLVFMPGVREIRATMQKLQGLDGVEVLPLHGGLNPEERDEALLGNKPSGVQRRVIVATNIAETSVTVPGITVVVDSCRQRSVRYNPKTGIEERGTELISKDQAEQRAGRAGRVEPGKCYRILTEDDFEQLDQHPDSEIKRKNLSHVILLLKRLGIDPTEFPFIEPPEQHRLAEGVKELERLGAIDAGGILTEVGVDMGELPFEPSLARMVVEAKRRNTVEATLVLAAFEREQRVLHGPSRKDDERYGSKQAARDHVQRIQDKFDSGQSDWLKNLEIFKAAIEQGVFEASRRDKSPAGRQATKNFRRWCREHYLKEKALTHIAYRLRDYFRYAGERLDVARLTEQLAVVDEQDLGAIILSGYPDKLLYRPSSSRSFDYRYLDERGQLVNMNPSSEGFDAKPELCIAAGVKEGPGRGRRGREIIRNYAEHIHPIGLAELQEVMPHLVTERVVATRYNPATDRVETEFTLHPKDITSIELGKDSRPASGEAASRAFADALARGEVQAEFAARNLATLADIQKLCHRTRGAVQPPENMRDWYLERLEGVASVAEASARIDALTLRVGEHYPDELRAELDPLYPPVVQIGTETLSLEYEYRPKVDTYYSKQDERFTVKLELSREQLEQLDDDFTIVIGPDDNQTLVTLQVEHEQGATVGELKDIFDQKRIVNEWYSWDKPTPQPVTVEQASGMDDASVMGYDPQEYTRDRYDNPVFAIPAVEAQRKGYGETTTYDYRVVYCRNREEADTKLTKTREIIANEQRRVQLAQDRAELGNEASAAIEACRAIVDEVRGMEEYWNRSALAVDVIAKYDEAEKSLRALDSNGRDAGDPRRAMRLAAEAVQLAETFKFRRAEREQLLPEVRQQLDALRFYTKLLRNITVPQVEQLEEQFIQAAEFTFNELDRLVGQRDSDLTAVAQAIAEAQRSLVDSPIGPWVTQEARAYLRVVGEEQSNVYAKIRVQDGVVYDGDDNRVNEFVIGGSGRSMVVRRGSDGKLRGQSMYASGSPMGSVVLIPDGEYAFTRDATSVYSVELDDAGNVIVPHGVVNLEVDYGAADLVRPIEANSSYESPYGSQPDTDGSVLGDVFATQLRAAREQAARRKEQKQVADLSEKPADVPLRTKAKSRSTTPRGEAVSGDALRAAFGIAPERGNDSSRETPPSTTPDTRRAPEKRPEEPMSAKEREKIISGIQFAESVINMLKTLGRRPRKGASTVEDRALDKMYQQIDNANGHIEAAHEITEDSAGKFSSANGRVGNAKATIERAAKAINDAMLSRNLDNQWLDQLTVVWDAVEQAVRENVDAQEFIEAELVTQDELALRLRSKLISDANEVLRGRLQDIDEVLEKILSDI